MFSRIALYFVTLDMISKSNSIFIFKGKYFSFYFDFSKFNFKTHFFPHYSWGNYYYIIVF